MHDHIFDNMTLSFVEYTARYSPFISYEGTGDAYCITDRVGYFDDPEKVRKERAIGRIQCAQP